MAKNTKTPASELVENPGGDKEKKQPPISRTAFLKAAKALEVNLAGFPMGADVKEFSTGSYGWNINQKASIKVGDVSVPVQVGLNVTVVNSKNDPK